MLKYLALILLIANITLWGWSKGWFGEDPSLKGRDPQRIHQQIRPQAIRIVPREATRQPPTLSSIPQIENTQPSCIQTGPLDNTQATQLQELLGAQQPQLSWNIHIQTEPTSWLIYLGKFDSEQDAIHKKAELARAGIESELITNRAEYQPGLTLGFFRQAINAENQLEALHNQNIPQARIIAWTTQPVGQLLRIEEVTADQIQPLNNLAIQAGAPAFKPCEALATPSAP